MNTVTVAYTAARKSILKRAENARARRELARDISGYSTPAQLAELHAIIARHDPSETREVEAVLARQESDQYRAAQVHLSPR